MNNSEFWASIDQIIRDGFTPEGLNILERYAEQFANGQLLFKRFSPQEQHGCAAGGPSNVIATILAGRENSPDNVAEKLSDFKRELKRGAEQAEVIENWAKATGCWIDNVDSQLSHSFGEEIAEGGEAKVYDNGSIIVKSIGLDYFIHPTYALDRISLHNAFFPETALSVIGFGRDSGGNFKIIVEQPYICGVQISQTEIEDFMSKMGFELRNRRNWTYTTPEIYLSDMHDENVIKSDTGTIFVIDCDIRINIPELRQGGTRAYTNEIEFT